MDRISLIAEERLILGKKVRFLRREGFVPGNVYGNTKNPAPVTMGQKDFSKVYAEVGETGLIDLKIGTEKVRPVMIKNIQYHPATGRLVHVDFFQVDLAEKVEVPVPVELIGEAVELVKMGEAVVLQNLSEVQVSALPTDLIEKFEIDISKLLNIEDAVTVADLQYDRSKITILTEPEEVIVKLAPAVTEEMKALLEEQEAEAAAAAVEAAPEGEEADTTEEGAEGETPSEGEEAVAAEPAEETKEE